MTPSDSADETLESSDSTQNEVVPGRRELGPWVAQFDGMVDRALDAVRGNTLADRVFTTASHIGEFSIVWHTTNFAVGLVERKPRRVAAFAVLIGLESLIVNQGIKRLFRRERPTTSGEAGLGVRTPLTSSFPSGHASAATFATIMIAPRVPRPIAVGVAITAAAVATSRAYVRIHHASDVVGGIVTGALLGSGARYVTQSLLRRRAVRS